MSSLWWWACSREVAKGRDGVKESRDFVRLGPQIGRDELGWVSRTVKEMVCRRVTDEAIRAERVANSTKAVLVIV